MTDRADLSAPRPLRIGVAVAVVLLHVLVIAALVRAFAPDFAHDVAQQVTSAFTVTVSTPPPSPSPTPEARARASEPAGAAAEAGKRAQPREVASPRPKLVVAPPQPAPPVAAKGSADTSGTGAAGSGTGAGGHGSGTGAGGSGTGRGGGATKVAKLSGEINSARDYPRASRELRIGDHVIVMLTVGTDGRVKSCRVQRASRDAEADRITCRLATERFRFRPATDANGQPVEAIYGWQQKWFYPAEKN